METVEFPFHRGARTSLYVAAALLIVLVCAAPIGVYFIWRVSRGKVTIDGTRLRAEGLLTDEVQFCEVERLGILKSPMVALGIGGMLARMKLKGMDHGVNLVAKLRSGKNVKFLLNQYENHEQIIERVKQACPSIPLENIAMGALTWKWPEPPPRLAG